jgi:glycosidase
VARTGHNRTINRQKLDRAGLERELADPRSLRSQVLAAYRRLLRARASDPGFHPFGQQQVLALGDSIFALRRTSPQGNSRVLCLHNVSPQAEAMWLDPGAWHDLLSGEEVHADPEGVTYLLPPYAVRWFASTGRGAG